MAKISHICTYMYVLLFGLEVVSYLASCHDVTKVVLPWCHLRPRGRVYGGGSTHCAATAAAAVTHIPKMCASLKESRSS